MILPFRSHDRITGALGLLRLVPDRPYTAEDLAYFQELSDRTALALDNARLYQETQVAVRARDEFLSAAAHELRTPITTVKGYAQMLLRAQIRAGLASAHASQFLQAIDEATERLRVLSDDLLDVSRLRLGQMPLHLQPLDLGELAGRLIRRLESRLDGRHAVTLESRLPAAVVPADPTRIEQVLANMFDNAVKYSPAGGEIRIVIVADGAGIRLSVRDPGIGLPPEAVESIFAPFNRADNAIRDNIPGLGLGLYICDSIVRRHGGHITAESAGEGHGTTVHLWLPTAGIAEAEVDR
jgi:signal transduction histidine kinase